jgi:hypothetical protein
MKSCIDFYGAQTNVKGVLIIFNWASLESDTAGIYDGSVGNHLGAAGTIGFPLIDDLATYVASKGMKLILGMQWYSSSAALCNQGPGFLTPDHNWPTYLIQSSCVPGTDAAGTYGALILPGVFDGIELWKPAVMDRWVALERAYGARYDTNAAVEMLIPLLQEVDCAPCVGHDGYSDSAVGTQVTRAVTEAASAWPHTEISVPVAWLNPPYLGNLFQQVAGMKTAGTMTNNTVAYQTDYNEHERLGLGAPFGTHDYRTEMPFTVWTAGPELCDDHVSKPNADAANNYTPQEFYDALMTAGKTDQPGHPVKPNRWILAVKDYGAYCPSVASQNWGAINGTGWYNFIQTHPTVTTCPSLFMAAGGCKTD